MHEQWRCSKKAGSELSDWIMRATRDDATLLNSALTGVIFCPIGIVQTSLTSRKVRFARNAPAHTLRCQLRAILQLEQEYTSLVFHVSFRSLCV